MVKRYFVALNILGLLGSLVLSMPCLGEEVKEEKGLPEVVVTATRTEKEVEVAPASVYVVTKEKIEIQKPKTTDEALKGLPGVMLGRGQGLMDTLSAITLRGIPGQKRTLILMDGVPLNDAYKGFVPKGGFYPEDLERIEVVKGPFSSLYGGYAMGGVVQFFTKMPEKREMFLKAGYGSSFDRGDAMDDLKRVYISYGDKIKNFSFFVSYGRHDTNGYPTDFVTYSKIPFGTIGAKPSYDNYGNPVYVLGDKGDERYWDDGITLKAQYEFDKNTRLRFTFMRNRYEYNYDEPHPYLLNATTGAPLYYPSESSYPPGDGGRIQNLYATYFETELFKRLKTKLNLSYVNVEKDWYVTPLSKAKIGGCAAGTKPEDCGYVSNTPQRALTADLQLTLPLFSNQLLTFGGYYRWEYADTKEKYLRNWKDEDSTVRLKSQSKGKTRTYAFYVQDEIALRENLTVYLGGRVDFWKTYDGYVNQVGTKGYPKKYESNTETSFSPKFALVYKPFEKTTLRASLGKAFRPPTIFELYLISFVPGRRIVRFSNPNLSPETVWAYELGISQDLWKGAKFSFTGFYNKMDDLIYPKVLNATHRMPINVGKAESKGFEVGLEQKFDFGLKLFANLTYTDSEILENKVTPEMVGKRLVMFPLWMGNLGVELKRGRFSAYVIGRYMDKMYFDDMNRDKKSGVYGSYDEYFVVDARLSYELTKFATLSLSFDNLFDRDYYYYYKAPGASWFAELSIKF